MAACSGAGLQTLARASAQARRRAARSLGDRKATLRSPSARDGTLRRASRSQPARSELSTPARIGRAAETWRAAAARSGIRTRAPSVPHDCRPNAAVLRPTRRGGTAVRRAESCARLRRRGCGARVRPWWLGLRIGHLWNQGVRLWNRGCSTRLMEPGGFAYGTGV